MNNTYLTTEELSARIKYDARTIRQCLKDSVLATARSKLAIPMANGGVCNG